ncbi:unnamed protein product [Brachionus calyciflorus]|uniref:Uncharacterized protein n=1 Tax=Brachionus calyciflorus TaxID=104777 RepID=A0A813SYS9_9BILA|nr:unnamed protein product [Brachionus calyciflorus]
MDNLEIILASCGFYGILEEVEEKSSVLDEEISNLEIGKKFKLHLPDDPIPIQKLFGNLEINADGTRLGNYECFQSKNQGSIQCLKLLKSGDLVSLSKYSIQIWNLQSEKCLKEIKDLSQFINCLEETSCGNLLTAHLDRRIKIWEPNKGHVLNEFTVHTSLIICLKIMGKSILAIAFEDHTFKIWNYITKTCIKTFLESDVTCLDKLNDSLLVIGTAYGKIKLKFLMLILNFMLELLSQDLVM